MVPLLLLSIAVAAVGAVLLALEGAAVADAPLLGRPLLLGADVDLVALLLLAVAHRRVLADDDALPDADGDEAGD